MPVCKLRLTCNSIHNNTTIHPKNHRLNPTATNKTKTLEKLMLAPFHIKGQGKAGKREYTLQ